jgi:hypothetical protein
MEIQDRVLREVGLIVDESQPAEAVVEDGAEVDGGKKAKGSKGAKGAKVGAGKEELDPDDQPITLD